MSVVPTMTEYSEGRFQALAVIEAEGIGEADKLAAELFKLEDEDYRSAYFIGFQRSVNDYIANSLA